MRDMRLWIGLHVWHVYHSDIEDTISISNELGGVGGVCGAASYC